MGTFLLVALLPLSAIAVLRPGWVAAVAIAVAPLHLYRWSLPSAFAEIPLPSGNISLFRVAIAALAVGAAAHLARARIRGGITRDRTFWITTGLAGATALLIAFQAYQAYRGLTPLARTAGSAHAFYFAAVGLIATALIHQWLSARTAVITAVASAVPILILGLAQFFGPGTAEDKYNTPVLFGGLLEAADRTDQVRPGGLTAGLFRPASIFSDPNFLAIFAVATIILADLAFSRRMLRERRAGQLSLRGLQCLALGVLMVTYSRTGLIVLAAFVVVRYGPPALAHLRQSRSNRSRLVAAALIAGLLAVSAVTAKKFTESRQLGGSTASHIETLGQALDLWSEFPLIGAGIGNFGYVYGQPGDRSSAQSFPFTILAEQGLIGLLLFGATYWGTSIYAARRASGVGRVSIALPFLVGAWLYDFPLALDACAVWLALIIASIWVDELRARPTRPPPVR